MKNSQRNRNTGKINSFKQHIIDNGRLIKDKYGTEYFVFKGTLVRA